MLSLVVAEYGGVKKTVAFVLNEPRSSRRGCTLPAYNVNGVSFS